MDRFSEGTAQNIANYLDFEQFYKLKDEYDCLSYSDYWKDHENSVERSVDFNLDTFPTDVIKTVCNYLNIDQFYKLRKRYNFLSIEEYCQDSKFPIGNEESYVDYLKDIHYDFVKKADINWAGHAGYLELLKFFHERGDKITNDTMSCATKYKISKKDNYFELIKYVYSNGTDCVYLVETDSVGNVLLSQNLEAIKFMFDIAPKIKKLYWKGGYYSMYCTSIEVIEYLKLHGARFEVTDKVLNHLRENKCNNNVNYFENLRNKTVLGFRNIAENVGILDDLFQLVCNYLDIDQFYQIKDIYHCLNVFNYCKNVSKLPVGTEKSYKSFVSDTQGCEIPNNRFNWACYAGYLDVVRFFYNEDKKSTDEAMEIAVCYGSKYGTDRCQGSLELVIYLHKLGDSPDAAQSAITHGRNLSIIKYLYRHIPDTFAEFYNESDIPYGVYDTSLEILQFLNSVGVFFNLSNYLWERLNNESDDREVIKYLRQFRTYA